MCHLRSRTLSQLSKPASSPQTCTNGCFSKRGYPLKRLTRSWTLHITWHAQIFSKQRRRSLKLCLRSGSAIMKTCLPTGRTTGKTCLTVLERQGQGSLRVDGGREGQLCQTGKSGQCPSQRKRSLHPVPARKRQRAGN